MSDLGDSRTGRIKRGLAGLCSLKGTVYRLLTLFSRGDSNRAPSEETDGDVPFSVFRCSKNYSYNIFVSS